jgi:hypothetical protein
MWGAAVVTATPAAVLQLDSAVPVLAIGGFVGTLPTPALGQIKNWVARGQVRYLVLAGPNTGLRPGQTPAGLTGTTADQIVTWALKVGRPVDLPGTQTQIYDLTAWAHPAGPPGRPLR